MEAMLQAFKNIDLNVVTLEGQVYHHITPLSKLQQRIFALLDLPARFTPGWLEILKIHHDFERTIRLKAQKVEI